MNTDNKIVTCKKCSVTIDFNKKPEECVQFSYGNPKCINTLYSKVCRHIQNHNDSYNCLLKKYNLNAHYDKSKDFPFIDF